MSTLFKKARQLLQSDVPEFYVAFDELLCSMITKRVDIVGYSEVHSINNDQMVNVLVQKKGEYQVIFNEKGYTSSSSQRPEVLGIEYVNQGPFDRFQAEYKFIKESSSRFPFTPALRSAFEYLEKTMKEAEPGSAESGLELSRLRFRLVDGQNIYRLHHDTDKVRYSVTRIRESQVALERRELMGPLSVPAEIPAAQRRSILSDEALDFEE